MGMYTPSCEMNWNISRQMSADERRLASLGSAISYMNGTSVTSVASGMNAWRARARERASAHHPRESEASAPTDTARTWSAKHSAIVKPHDHEPSCATPL